MTTAVAAASCERRHQDRADQLKQLRRRMAAVAGKVGVTRAPAARGDDLDPASESLLAVPDLLADTLPGGLPRGTVAVLSGARSLPVSMVAAVTAAGGHAAIVGQPDIGLLAAAEMGAELSRLAVIPDPGPDPVEIAAVLIDGMDLVVLGLAGAAVAPSRARVLAARARQRGCALVVTDGDWPGAALRLQARVRGYDTSMGATPGCGRLSGVRLAVRGAGRATRGRAG
ncbi:hypothetical protein H7J77_07910 [Mycolicibacillus parakoreensis]|uniref:DNA recombination-mediator protein A n=1 Tax=Mycolicibacillus parakoreensis TaxID=1069221 RepID=A0ABY3U400_9MYCO|nr:hypothetical protein [Mycolicibacillus parakoreensis]MCV7315463.1 hypothetical protein [Mycolicibacillus parakoreensis]ULN54694.1 hypothetical protein MIU77_14590 [Mycolicibacillus parakoreensis]